MACSSQGLDHHAWQVSSPLLTDLTLDSLRRDLFGLLAQIPSGHTTTFGRLARALGCGKAAVWVAKAVRELLTTPDSEVPAWRVVDLRGQIVNGEAAAWQAARLTAEGVPLDGRQTPLSLIVDPTPLKSPPLRRLIDAQIRLATELPPLDVRDAGAPLPRFVLGLDVSYAAHDAAAIAACVRVDTTSGACVASVTATVANPLPYIPTLLAWRELPALRAALAAMEALLAESAEAAADEICFVDGAGSLHPLRLGIATHLALVTSRRTIGITKSALGGRAVPADRASRARIIWPSAESDGDEKRSERDMEPVVALQVISPRYQPLFVSGGQGVPLGTAARWTEALAFGRHLPAPIHWADQISRKTARNVPS